MKRLDSSARARRRGKRPKRLSRLKPVSTRPPLHTYMHQLWQRRHFIMKQAWASALSQHQGTLLGNVWLIVTPMLDGAVYFLIFGVVFGGHRQVPNFIGFLLIGVFLFAFTSRCVTSATRSISAERNLVRAFTFPRAALPLAAVWRELIALLPVLYTLVILLLVVPPRGKLGITWLLIPAVVLLHMMLNLGVGFIMARLGAQIPDLQHIVPYAVRLMLYMSAVMFTVDRFDNHPPLGWLVRHNPLFLVLDMYRSILLYDRAPPASQWQQLAVWAGGLTVFGLVFFWHAEVKYARAAME